MKDTRIECPYCKSKEFTIQMLHNGKPHYCVCMSQVCQNKDGVGRVF